MDPAVPGLGCTGSLVHFWPAGSLRRSVVVRLTRRVGPVWPRVRPCSCDGMRPCLGVVFAVRNGAATGQSLSAGLPSLVVCGTRAPTADLRRPGCRPAGRWGEPTPKLVFWLPRWSCGFWRAGTAVVRALGLTRPGTAALDSGARPNSRTLGALAVPLGAMEQIYSSFWPVATPSSKKPKKSCNARAYRTRALEREPLPRRPRDPLPAPDRAPRRAGVACSACVTREREPLDVQRDPRRAARWPACALPASPARGHAQETIARVLLRTGPRARGSWLANRGRARKQTVPARRSETGTACQHTERRAFLGHAPGRAP
jgi:hypothetical protein